MARSNLTDYLQVYPFWMFDAFPIEFGSLPVLTPLFGFASITAPEISIQTQDIREGNWHYPRKVVKDAELSPMTVTRGVTFPDSDFYRWIITAIEGDPGYFSQRLGLNIGGVTPRRNFVLVHFLSRSPIPAPDAPDFVESALNTVGPLISPIDFLTRRIPGRAWLINGAIPRRYKAGGDFDAMSSAISVQELDIEYEGLEQITLTS